MTPFFTFPLFYPVFFFTAWSQCRRHFSLHLSEFLHCSFFSTPFKRANTSLIFPLNTFQSVCPDPPLLSLWLFFQAKLSLLVQFDGQSSRSIAGSPIILHISSLTLMLHDPSPHSSELWDSYTLGNKSSKFIIGSNFCGLRKTSSWGTSLKQKPKKIQLTFCSLCLCATKSKGYDGLCSVVSGTMAQHVLSHRNWTFVTLPEYLVT